MKIYSARLLFVISIEGAGEKQLNEEFYLLKASTEKEAFRVACEKGEADDESFTNKKGHLVSWKFVGVTELSQLDFEQNFTHVGDRTILPADPERFLASIQERVNELKQSYLYQPIS